MIEPLIKDSYFKVNVYAQTHNPQLCCYLDMHQDYSEGYAFDEFFGDYFFDCDTKLEVASNNDFWLDPFKTNAQLPEKEAGERVIRHCLKQRHWGILEGPTISFAIGGYPHSLQNQARTHRVGVTFNVQSFRYTGQRILDVAQGKKSPQEVFYFRPIGDYTNRQGKKYTKTVDQIDFLYGKALSAAKDYQIMTQLWGYSEEDARSILPFDVRQNWTVTFNIRSLFHFLDMRTPADAQLEIRDLCHRMWPYVVDWVPEFAEFYYNKRWSKNQLAP